MRILYHDPVPVAQFVEHDLQLEFVSKEQLLLEADFVSIHVPLSDATRKLIGEPELMLMKTTAILVNTARGPVVASAAVAQARAAHWYGGAASYGFQREPEVHPGMMQHDTVCRGPRLDRALR